MARPFLVPALAVLTAGLLAGCANTPSEADLRHRGQYWQRANTSSAIYLRGPKAQQTLNQDIARCVSDLRELERLGAIREAFPADPNPDGTVPDPATPPGRMAQWDTPSRKGPLYSEHLDYHDFEGCMASKGWERVENLPYDIAKKARGEYLDVITGREYRTRIAQDREPPVPAPQGDYSDLNQ